MSSNSAADGNRPIHIALNITLNVTPNGAAEPVATVDVSSNVAHTGAEGSAATPVDLTANRVGDLLPSTIHETTAVPTPNNLDGVKRANTSAGMNLEKLKQSTEQNVKPDNPKAAKNKHYPASVRLITQGAYTRLSMVAGYNGFDTTSQCRNWFQYEGMVPPSNYHATLERLGVEEMWPTIRDDHYFVVKEHKKNCSKMLDLAISDDPRLRHVCDNITSLNVDDLVFACYTNSQRDTLEFKMVLIIAAAVLIIRQHPYVYTESHDEEYKADPKNEIAMDEFSLEDIHRVYCLFKYFSRPRSVYVPNPPDCPAERCEYRCDDLESE